MTLRDLLRLAESIAISTGTDLADYRYVMSVVLQMSPSNILLHQNMAVSELDCDKLVADFHKLGEGFPPQYIIGKAWFCGLELITTSAVLIPRPETEELVELCLSNANKVETVLELGTGSGAIAITLKKAHPEWQITATELSSEALEVARRNADNHKAAIEFLLCDGFPERTKTYDLIVSNPPYISEAEFADLPAKVKDHEPRLALLGGADGLYFYRLLLEQGSLFLSPKGLLAIEHGWTQKSAICQIALDNGWKQPEAFCDLSGRDRFMLIRRQ